MDDRLPEILCAAYGFERVAIGRRLEGGYANDLFEVRADDRRLVLRLKRPPVDERDIAWEHDLTRLLAERMDGVVAPLPGRDGRTFIALGDRVGWLMPFVDGAAADPGREADRAAAARALGRLHRVGREIAVEPRAARPAISHCDWPPAVAPQELGEWRSTIEGARSWAVALVRDTARERTPTTGLVHGDIFPGNVLVGRDGGATLIDWEEARLDWVTWDLAIAVGTLCAAGDGIDGGAVARFVATYRAGGGTAPAHEDDLLLPFVRAKRILEVLRAPTDRAPRWDHQRRNLRSLDSLGAPLSPPSPTRARPSGGASRP